MDNEILRKQVADELQSQFETKLREIKRQKSHAEEELETASERWRSERRKLNAEIDRLESALSDARTPSRRKGTAETKPGAVNPQEIAGIQNAAEEKLKRAASEWETERTRLTSQISRLERAVAEAIERSANPIRSTQPLKEQFEAKLEAAARERTEFEQEFLRARAVWDEEKKKLTGEIIKLRRLAPPSKALEAKEKLEQLRGRKETVEEIRIRELEAELSKARDEVQKYHQASIAARDATRGEYEPRLEQAYRERVQIEEQLAAATRQWNAERDLLHNHVAQLQQSVVQTKSEIRSKRETDLLQEAGLKLEESTKERERLQAEVQKLQRALSETRDQVNAEVVDQLRRQYDARMQEMTQQKTQIAQELQAATELLATERSRFSKEVSQGGGALDSSAIADEVARIEEMILKIGALIDDPATELSMVIRKNVEKAELDAYLKGILFSLGKGKGL